MTQTVSMVLGVVLVIAIGGFVYWQNSATPTPQVTNNVDGGTPQTGITMDAIAQHASRESCWTAINGSVYDLTSWIPKHPGGEQAILQLCGTDGSEAFNGMHGGDPAKETILAGFRIGAMDGAQLNTQPANAERAKNGWENESEDEWED